MKKLPFLLLVVFVCTFLHPSVTNAAFVIKNTEATKSSTIGFDAKNSTMLQKLSSVKVTKFVENKIHALANLQNGTDTNENQKMATWFIVAMVGLAVGAIGLILCLFVHSLLVTVFPFIFGFLFAFGWGYLTGAKMGEYLGKNGEIKTKNIDIKTN